MKISKEAKAGILVSAAIALFIFGFNFLKGRNVFSSQRNFYAIYDQIDGLVEANPVMLNGMKVGQVSKLSFAPGTTGKVIVTMMIDNEEIKIPANSKARIFSSDLLGSKAVELIYGSSEEIAEDGDTLTADIQATLTEEVNRQVKPLKDKAESLISSIDSVMVVVQAVLNKDAREDLLASFESIKKSIQTFEHTARTLDTLVTTEKRTLTSILSRIESITINLANNNDKISMALNNIANITDSIAKSNLKSTIDNTNKVMADASKVMDKINNGEGTVGMLINDKGLYTKLDSASKALDFLLRDMEKYPGVYFPFKGKGDSRRKKREERKVSNP